MCGLYFSVNLLIRNISLMQKFDNFKLAKLLTTQTDRIKNETKERRNIASHIDKGQKEHVFFFIFTVYKRQKFNVKKINI